MSTRKIATIAIVGALAFLPVMSSANASLFVNASSNFNTTLADEKKPEITKLTSDKIEGGYQVTADGKNLSNVTKITILDKKGKELAKIEKKDFIDQKDNKIIFKTTDLLPDEVDIKMEYNKGGVNEIIENPEEIKVIESGTE